MSACPLEVKMKNKKWFPLLLLFVGALAIELIICNFSSWKSLFYRNRIVFENVQVDGGSETEIGPGSYLVPEGILTLHIDDVDTKVHNLFLALDFSEDTPVSYTVSLTDEGNYYPYFLPEQILMPGIRRSFYTNVNYSSQHLHSHIQNDFDPIHHTFKMISILIIIF